MADNMEVVEEEVTAEATPPADEGAEPAPDEEAAVGGVMTHTIDEIPALRGKGVGDTITFRIAGVSEDGNEFNMEAMAEAPPPAEAAPPPPEAGGMGEISAALQG